MSTIRWPSFEMSSLIMTPEQRSELEKYSTKYNIRFDPYWSSSYAQLMLYELRNAYGFIVDEIEEDDTEGLF